MKNRRFIAGAVCPRCAVMDRIFIVKQGESSIRECLSCGYKDQMTNDGKIKELTTRVNTDEHGDIVSGFEASAEIATEMKNKKKQAMLETTAKPVRIIVPDDGKVH